MKTSEGTARQDVQGYIDSVGVGWRQWLIFTVLFLTLLADGMDITIVSHIFPSLVKEWGTPIGGIAFVVTGGFVAMGLGAIVAGGLADRWGRKSVTTAALLLVGAATILGGTASNFEMFALWRFVACLGLGAVMPLALTLLADLVPAARRAQMLAFAYAGVGLGTTAGALLAGIIIPSGGWRPLMVAAGVIPLMIAFAFAVITPESPMLLASRNEIDKARRALARLAPGRDLSMVDIAPLVQSKADSRAFRLILSRPFAVTTVLLWVFSFIALGTQLLIAQYLPTLLQAPVPGLSTVQSSAIVGSYGAASVVGTFILGALLKKFSRYAVISLVLLSSLVGLLVVGLFPLREFATLLVIFTVLGFILPTGFGPSRDVLSAVAYPAHARGTGLGTANLVARVGTAAGGVAGGALIGAGLSLSGLFLALLLPVGALMLTLGGLRLEAGKQGTASIEGLRDGVPQALAVPLDQPLANSNGHHTPS